MQGKPPDIEKGPLKSDMILLAKVTRVSGRVEYFRMAGVTLFRGRDVYVFLGQNLTSLFHATNEKPNELMKEVIELAAKDDSVLSCEFIEVSNEAELVKIMLQ